ncbi:MAG: YtxH domain-containing protein [Tannerellaceae bacterium]|nr:hypothetical protein [Porphyromonadaceae bacterium]
MKNVDSKLLLGLVVGAAVGAAVGYLVATDKKDRILDELEGVVNKVKDSVKGAIHKNCPSCDSVETPAVDE